MDLPRLVTAAPKRSKSSYRQGPIVLATTFTNTEEEKDVLGWSDSYSWNSVVNDALFTQQDVYKNAETYALSAFIAKLADYWLRPKYTSGGEGPLIDDYNIPELPVAESY